MPVSVDYDPFEKAAQGKPVDHNPFAPTTPPDTSRTFGQAATDIGAGLISGVGGAAKFVPQMYGLATGDFSDTGVMGIGNKLQQYGEEMKSPGLKAREQLKEEKVKEAEKSGQLSALGREALETIKDPALLTNFVAQQLPEQLPAIIAAIAAPELSPAVAASKAAARKAVGTAAEKAAAEAAQAAAVKSGARAAIGTGALQQGSDVGAQVYKATYDKMIADGVKEPEARERALKYARATGVAGAAISLGAQNLPGGKKFAEALAGKEGKTASRLVNAARLGLEELPSEEIEEVGGQLAQNVAQQQVDPNAELTEGLGRTAAQAGIGAIGTAGGMGLLQKPAQKPGTTPPAPPAAPETPPATPPVNPPATPPGNVAPGANPDLSQHFENYHQGLPDASSTVFQNRDRSTDASIQQMQGVAADPRYNDLSVSRSFGSGAPVVMTDEKLNENQLGNYEMTTASDGTKIPVRYAVVDAHELLPSHSHDGTKNAEYQDLSVSAIRPVAGNGRVAGIQEAYQRGTADKYKEELVNDAAHGIDPKTIADMKQPVLVRVMPKSFVTPNIGDISNVSGISGLSAIDAAKQDANRIDINSLKFHDNGDPHIDSLRDFVNAMPVSEHPDLKDLFGQPSKKAEDRLMNAVFWKAYGNEQLINLYGPTRDAESRLVLNSLGTVAPKMAQLDGAGEYDIRPYVTQAAEAAVNARRRNIPLEDMAKQMDIGTNPYTQRILQMFADSGRSGKKITEGLNNLANAALEEHNRTDTDMFGEVPRRSLDEVFNRAFEGEKDLFTTPNEPPKKKTEEPKDTFFQKPQLSKAELLKRLNGKNIVEAAQILVDIAHDSYHKGIAEHILRKVQEFDRRGVPMTFSTKYVMNKKRSSLGRVFSPSGLGKINFIMEINGEKGSTFEILAHEFIHLISLAEIKFLGTDNPLVKELDDLRRLVHKQWRKDKKEGKYIRDEFSINYAFKKSTGVEGDFYAEFITQGLTDPAMQKYLAGIKVGNKTALDKLMEFVRKVLNLSPEYETALDRLIRISTDMFENPALEIAKDLEKKGYTLGVPTTPQAPPGRLKSNPKMTAEESPIQPSQATGAGRDALDSLRDMGREVEEQPKSFYENLKSYWDNAIDNPGMAIEDAKKAATKFSDKIQTWMFSSDSAFNNNIKRGIMQADGEMNDKVRNLLNISTSQAVGADILASGALLEGKLRYDDEVQKWEVVKDKYNQIALENSINDFAKKYNMTYQEAELVTHMAFEARRTQSLKDFNASIASAPEEIEALNELLNSLTGNDPDTKAQRAEVKAAISRFENLAKQKPKLIHLSDEQIATGLDFFKSMPELQDTVDIWQGMRNNAKDALVESGLWSEEYAEQMMSNIDYVPFQREFEEEEAKGGDKNYLSGLMVKAREFKMTGSERPVANIVDNMAKWIEYSYNRSIRNSQAKAMIDTAMSKDLESLEIAKKIPHPIKNANVVRIWRDGKEEFYDMKDPLFVDAFAGIQAVSVPTVKFFSKFANILRESVVMNPLFAVSQVPQDAFSAIFTSGLSPQYALRIPALAAKEFVKTLRRTSTTHEELKKYRAVGYTDFTSDLARRDAEVYAGVKPPPGGWGKVKGMLKHISMASDNAVRQAVYEASVSAGLTRGEAIEKAFEVFNVRRRGTSTTLRVASQVIPFFNAYLAVQNVAYRTITGTGISPTERTAALQTLAMTTGSVMALSLLYAMMNGDDDDYLKKPTTVRDRLLMIPGSGGLSIPLRNDIFTIPKIVTEHLYLLMTNNATEDGRKFRDSMASALTSSLMAPTPVPQAIKPAVEVALNYDFFQNRNLINPFMLKEDVSRQFNDSTSELGKVLGKTGLIAPINADHIIRGMFGSVGGLTLMLTNPILHTDPNVERPTIGWHDVLASVPGSSGFISKENQTGLKRDFYILKDEVDKAAATFNDIKKRTPSEAADYMKSKEHQMRVGMHGDIDKIAKNLSNIQNAIAIISNKPNMDPDKKEKQIENLHKQEELILKNINIKKLRAMAML